MMKMIAGFIEGGSPVVESLRSETKVCWEELGDKSQYLLLVSDST